MKICVVGKANHLFWDQNVVDTLKFLGHEVQHFQINQRAITTEIVRNVIKPFNTEYAKEISDKFHADNIRKQCVSFQPDIVFFVSAFFIPVVYYELLKELPSSPLIVAWDGDTAVRYPKNESYSNYIDVLMSGSKYYVDNKVSYFPNTHHLLMAVNEKFFFRNSEHISKAYFCAAYTRERGDFIEHLSPRNIVVKGWGWGPFIDTIDTKNLEIINKKIKLLEVANDYRQYILTLNMHQKANAPHGELNMRTFEAPACGSIILSDYREEMYLAYEPGREVLMYKNTDEANEHMDKLFRDKNYTKKLSENAYKKTISEHTYTKRIEYCLDIIKQY